MASFATQPALSIDVDAGSNLATIGVTGSVSFSDLERQLMAQGLEIRVAGRMFGQDTARDEDLNVRLESVGFTGVQPARVDYTLAASRIPGKSLNEDAIGKDEVFAQLTLTNSLNPTPVATRDSNVVSFFFRNN